LKKTISTFNEWHLGDNLIHLNYISKLSKKYPEIYFKHYLRKSYIHLLQDLIADNKKIQLFPLEEKTIDEVNCWIGSEGYYYNSPLANNWTAFHIDFFNQFSKKLELISPISSENDLFFDFSALNGPSPTNRPYNFLIVNSAPMSSQITDFNREYLNNLTRELVFKGYSVMTTHPTGIVESTLEKGFNLIEIARISNHCEAIIGIPNGPMWLTFNIFNKDNIKFRALWLSAQTLNLGNNCFSCDSSTQISNILRECQII